MRVSEVASGVDGPFDPTWGSSAAGGANRLGGHTPDAPFCADPKLTQSSSVGWHSVVLAPRHSIAAAAKAETGEAIKSALWGASS